MKRILHALAALWPSKTEDRRAETEERSRKVEDRWKTEERRREHEGPWLPEARNGLLQHLNAMMRMGETVRELATRECVHLPSHEFAKEQPNESANQQIDESAPKKTDNQLPKRVIVSEREQPAERIGEPLPIAQVLARVYLRSATQCIIGKATQASESANQPISESAIKSESASKLLTTAVAILLAVFMCLLSAQQVSAQAEPATAAATSRAVNIISAGIQPGERVPDISIGQILNDQTGVRKLSDFAGKLLILDFWATWCAPCVAMLPKIDSLQHEFDDRIQFISVTYQRDEEVIPFLNDLEERNATKLSIPSITGDNALRKLFPHTYLPHYVWIDGKGEVVAITGMDEINRENILSFLDAGTIKLGEKTDVVRPGFDVKKSMFSPENGIDMQQTVYYSALTDYIEGIPGEYRIEHDEMYSRAIFVNSSLFRLYTVSFGTYAGTVANNRIILETKYPERITSKLVGDRYLQWLRDGHGYCYELKVKSNGNYNRIWESLRNHLPILFPAFHAEMVTKTSTVLALIRTSEADNLKSTHNSHVFDFTANGCKLINQPIDRFVQRLNDLYLQQHPIPIVNETGYTDYVDLELIADLTNIESINSALEKYHLKFVVKESEVEFLVISDN